MESDGDWDKQPWQTEEILTESLTADDSLNKHNDSFLDLFQPAGAIVDLFPVLLLASFDGWPSS